jgi:hypothetical protein
VYVKPGDPVEWFGEQALVANHHWSRGGPFVCVWRVAAPRFMVVNLSDLTVDGKPVLGLEGER